MEMLPARIFGGPWATLGNRITLPAPQPLPNVALVSWESNDVYQSFRQSISQTFTPTSTCVRMSFRPRSDILFLPWINLEALQSIGPNQVEHVAVPASYAPSPTIDQWFGFLNYFKNIKSLTVVLEENLETSGTGRYEATEEFVLVNISSPTVFATRKLRNSTRSLRVW